jgi:hypothetical protein
VNALDRLEADHANLLGALDHLASCGDPIQHGQLAVDLSSFWDLRGHWQLARREFLRYLGRADADRALVGRCTHGLGTVALDVGDYPGARARYEEGLNIAREPAITASRAGVSVASPFSLPTPGTPPRPRPITRQG